MKKLVLFLYFLAISITGISQSEFHTGVLIKNYNQVDFYTNLLHKIVSKSLSNDKELYLYSWDEKNSLINRIEENKEVSRPIAYVKYTQFNMTNMVDNPAIQYETDTTGKTIKAYFKISPSASYILKTIEIKTSQVLEISYRNLRLNEGISNTNYGVINVDFLKDFGGDPIKLKSTDSKAYEAALKKVLEKYYPIVKKINLDAVNTYSSSILSVIDGNYVPSKDKYFEVVKMPEDSDDKKVKYVTFNATTKDNLRKNGLIKLYQILDFGAKKTTKYVDLFSIDSVGLQSSQAKLNFFGNKKNLAETLRDSVKLLMFLTDDDLKSYNRKINNITDYYNVGSKKECLFCDLDFEKMLLNVPIVNLIERNAPEINTFYELAKTDKFVDFKSQELLNKQLGIRYLFSKMGENLVATDIVTSKIIGSNSTSSRKISNSAIVKNILIETFNKNIEWLKNKEATKNKVKETFLFSDFGFNLAEKIIIYKLVEEKVGNKVIKRKEEIANGFVFKIISDFICVFRIQNGEKEYFEAQNSKEEIVYEYKTN